MTRHHRHHRRPARDRLLVVLADDRSLPQQRRLLHRRQGQPRVKNAHGTLAAIVAMLGLLLIGIAHVAQSYGITAMDQTKPGYQSVVSQLVGAICGRSWFYDVTIGSVLLVLCLSANTSFVDFPRLCRLVAQDGFLPRPFAISGRRLVYSIGVVFLAVGAGGLLVLFRGITDALIPLFAVGAFLSFTLSQAGMAARWSRETGGGWRRLKLAINGLGALATGLALVVILAAKFTEGAPSGGRRPSLIWIRPDPDFAHHWHCARDRTFVPLA